MPGDVRPLPDPGGDPVDWLLALRPRHWLKNALVFAPAVAAHETSPELYLDAAMVFVVLTLTASGTYLWNDLLDLPSDRRHQAKRLRPLAAGRVPLRSAASLGAALAAGGLLGAFYLSAGVGYWVLSYLAVTLIYSLWLKRMVFLDVVVLALLFTVRVLAGAFGDRGRFVTLVSCLLHVSVSHPGPRQAPARAVRPLRGREVGIGRPGLRRRRPPGAGRARRGQQLRLGAGACVLHPEPDRCRAIRPSAGPVVELSVAALLAGSHDAARQSRDGRRRPAGVRHGRRDMMASGRVTLFPAGEAR